MVQRGCPLRSTSLPLHRHAHHAALVFTGDCTRRAGVLSDNVLTQRVHIIDMTACHILGSCSHRYHTCTRALRSRACDRSRARTSEPAHDREAGRAWIIKACLPEITSTPMPARLPWPGSAGSPQRPTASPLARLQSGDAHVAVLRPASSRPAHQPHVPRLPLPSRCVHVDARQRCTPRRPHQLRLDDCRSTALVASVRPAQMLCR